MILTKDQINFIKTHQGMIKGILESLKQDYFNRVVDEEDMKRKEVLSIFVKELRQALNSIHNIANLKEAKKTGQETYTGV